MRLVWGFVLLVAGVAGLVYVHALHPPQGVGDTVKMLVDRDGNYIKEPWYSVWMAVSGVAAVTGAALFATGLAKRGRK